jgi:hypothetical protein
VGARILCVSVGGGFKQHIRALTVAWHVQMMQAVVADADIIRLNCGGELIATHR